VVESIFRLIHSPAKPNDHWDPQNPDPSSSRAPFRVHNVGRGMPVPLLDFIRAIETECKLKAMLNFLPIQPGDVEETFADITSLVSETGFEPNVSPEEGMTRFIGWFREYYLNQKSD